MNWLWQDIEADLFYGLRYDVGYYVYFEKALKSVSGNLCPVGDFSYCTDYMVFGLSVKDAASSAMVGEADRPMVLFTALNLSKDLFVPITIVVYLYIGLTYGGDILI